MTFNIKLVEKPSAKRKENQANKKAGVPLLVYYYSQTGTAEDFAKRTAEDCENWGFSPNVSDVEEIDTSSFLEEVADKFVIFFASTYGEGDPPDAAVSFHEWLMSDELDSISFAGVKYAVFGLGNKSYERYNLVGKLIHKRLEELGGTPIFDLGLGDDEENIENDFLAWKQQLKPVICAEFGLSGESTGTINFKQKMVVVTDLKANFSPNIDRWQPKLNASVTEPDARAPLLADIAFSRELFSADAGRSCLHVEISTQDMLHYKAGYHLGIFPENDPQMVEELAGLLGLDLDVVVEIRSIDNNAVLVGPCTIRALLSQYYDIAFHVKKPTLKMLAHFASGPDKERLEALSSDDPAKQEEFTKYIVGGHRNINEILKEFPNIKIPAEHLFETLPRLQCRYYSISSSPMVHKDSVHITVAVEDWVTPTNRHAMGVATGWLARHQPNPEKIYQMPVYVRQSHFLLPASLSTPIIMVGPGTGLAPYRGFLQERRHLLQLPENKDTPKGECILFFGCRYASQDFMYQDELEGYLKDGTLDELQLAFSRDQAEKIYVQHRMKEGDMPSKIWKILNNDGHFYVCGDATHMAGDVSNALLEIISDQGGLSKDEAKTFFDKLNKDARYHADVW